MSLRNTTVDREDGEADLLQITKMGRKGRKVAVIELSEKESRREELGVQSLVPHPMTSLKISWP